MSSDRVKIDPKDVLDEQGAEAAEEAAASETPDSPVGQLWDILMAPCPPVDTADQALDPETPWHAHLNAAIQGASGAHGVPVFVHLIIGFLKLALGEREDVQERGTASQGAPDQQADRNPPEDMRTADDALAGAVEGPEG